MDISRIEMVLLGMIATKPSYAYEIDQYIKEKHMRRWVQIGSASVYQGLERLAKKGFAKPKREKEGKMPIRHRYHITDRGKGALEDAVRKLLAQCEDHYIDLNLGFFCCHVLPPSEIPGLLEERLSKLSVKYKEIRSVGKLIDKSHMWQQEAVLDALREFCQAEVNFLKKTIRKLKANQR